jgi:hypothetical protein
MQALVHGSRVSGHTANRSSSATSTSAITSGKCVKTQRLQSGACSFRHALQTVRAVAHVADPETKELVSDSTMKNVVVFHAQIMQIAGGLLIGISRPRLDRLHSRGLCSECQSYQTDHCYACNTTIERVCSSSAVASHCWLFSG